MKLNHILQKKNYQEKKYNKDSYHGAKNAVVPNQYWR